MSGQLRLIIQSNFGKHELEIMRSGNLEDSPEDGEGPGADLALFAIPLPDHPEVRVLAQAEG